MRSPKLHPEAVALLEAMEASGAPPVEAVPIDVGREIVRQGSKFAGGDPAVLARVEDIIIPGPGSDLRLRVYTDHSSDQTRKTTGQAGLIYIHGGGWVICDLDTHDPVCRAIAKQSGATVISVDYRMAPEHKFPAALEDCYAATLWVCNHAAQLGLDSHRIAIGGDSAGANMATVVAARCRDAGGPALAFQVLVYPVTDVSSYETESHREFAEGHYLTRATMEFFMSHYFTKPDERKNPEASPLLMADLSGLPPALLITAECDPLRDEGEAYGRQLKEAGVAVEFERYAGMFHPFLGMLGPLGDARRAVSHVARAIREMRPV
jgi:acetyl esterase